MGVDSRQILKRKKRARIFFIFLLIVLAVISSCVLYIIHNKEKLIADKMAGLTASFENKTGLALRYDTLDTDMTSMVSVQNLRIFPKDAADKPPLVFVKDMEVNFEIVASSLIPVKLRSIKLAEPRAELTISENGHPVLPENCLAIFRRMIKTKSEGEKKEGGEKHAGGRIEKFLSTILGLEVAFTGGSLTIEDNHYGRNAPVTINMMDLNGDCFLDLLNRRMNATVDGRIDQDSGRFSARLQMSKETKSLDLSARSLNLSFLAPYIPEKILTGPMTTLNGHVSIKKYAGNPFIPLNFDADLSGFGIEDPRLAKNPINNIRIKSEGKISLDQDSRVARVERAKIHLGSGAVNIKGSLGVPGEKKPVLDLTASAKDLPLQDFLDSIPDDFIPVLADARVDGRMDFDLGLHVDLNNAKATRIEPKVEIRDFLMAQAPQNADVRKLHGPFLHTARKKGEVVKSFMVGPENPDFVSFNNLGPVLIGAVLTCEDGRFFRHGGFVLKHIRDSIKDDIKREGFVRGASTVSMQTAKNLFLDHNKTASRKFQEMLLTWWIEKEIPKKRILEIYMNIIEWGPGLYGIGPAAHHYFGKEPANLSPLQCAFLGSIIKNPVYYHNYYTRGYVSHGWSTMLAFILRKMVERGTIEEEVFEWCDPYQPVFSKNGKPAFGGCKKPEDEEEKKEGENGDSANPAKTESDFDLIDEEIKGELKDDDSGDDDTASPHDEKPAAGNPGETDKENKDETPLAAPEPH